MLKYTVLYMHGPWDPEWLGAPNSRKPSSNKICPYKNIEIKGDQHITNNKKGTQLDRKLCDYSTKATPVGSTIKLGAKHYYHICSPQCLAKI